MGMYDNITVHADLCHLLVMPDDVRKLCDDWSGEVFQTKDLDNSLSNYKIASDGLLVEEVVEREYIYYTDEEIAARKEEAKKAGRKSLFDDYFPYKDVIVTSRREEVVNHHGTVRFYTSLEYSEDEDVWVEFTAYFIYGKLDKITADEVKKSKSSRRVNQEWMLKRQAEALKPLNRLKKQLNKIGWRKFWHFAGGALYQFEKLVAAARSKIYKHVL